MITMASYKVSEAQVDHIPGKDLNFKQVGVSISPQILYNFYSSAKLKVFADAGIGLNYYKYNKYYYETVDNGSVHRNDGFPELKSFMVSIPLMVGVEFSQHLQVYAGYIIPTSLTDYVVWSAKATSIQGGIKYLFK